jgi:hypothetical protein
LVFIAVPNSAGGYLIACPMMGDFVTHAVEKSTCNDTLMPFLAMFSKKGYGCK